MSQGAHRGRGRVPSRPHLAVVPRQRRASFTDTARGERGNEAPVCRIHVLLLSRRILEEKQNLRRLQGKFLEEPNLRSYKRPETKGDDVVFPMRSLLYFLKEHRLRSA